MRRLLLCLVLIAVVVGRPANAAPVNPVDGPFPQAHGELVTGIPPTTPCTTTLIKNAAFKNSAYGPDGAATGRYTPTCPGPWSMVVATISAYVDPGTQFDRIGELQVGGAELLHFTTPEGTNGRTTWSIQRDVTEASSLLKKPQRVWFQIGNVTDATYTGVFHGTVTLSFYAGHAASPDLVVPLNPVAAKDRNLPYLTAPDDRLQTRVRLPRNLTGLRAEVFTSGHGPCEEDWWYQPFACAGQPYREVGVYVDGRLAGIAPVFPALFTGGWGPDWWRPIPGPRTLDLRPYTVDLTPFVGTLTDARAHTFGVGILGWTKRANGDYWPTATNLLATVNHRSSGRTLGGVTRLSSTPQPAVSLLGEPGTLGGRYTATHELVATGWTQPAGAGRATQRVTTTIDATLVQVAAAVKSDWHWASSGTTGGVDATYQLVRDGARFAFVDTERRGTAGRWSQTDDRMQTSGPTLVTGLVGNSQESWVWSDSAGHCLDHELLASTQNVLLDQVTPSCPLL